MLLLAVLVAAGGCRSDSTGVLVVIALEDPVLGTQLDELQVVAVGRDAADEPHPADPPPPPYRVGGVGTSWPQSITILAGKKSTLGVDVLVLGLKAGIEVARGGAVVAFTPGAMADATVTLRAACRGVYCGKRSFCGADGQCEPTARKLDFAVNASGAGDQTSPVVASLGERGWVVAWADSRAGLAQIYTRRLQPDGVPIDAQDVQVTASSVAQSSPVLAASPAADAFVVGWAEADSGLLRLRRYSPSGSNLGEAESPSGAGGGTQVAPALGANPSGFIVAWQDSEAPAGATSSIRFRRGRWDAGWIDMAVAYAATAPTAAEQLPAACGSCGGTETFLVAWQDTSPSLPSYGRSEQKAPVVAGGCGPRGDDLIGLYRGVAMHDDAAPGAISSQVFGREVVDRSYARSRANSVPLLRFLACGLANLVNSG